jgi:hypothetical protein
VTITEFLLARIAEDEAAARTASIGSDRWHLGEFDETVLWWPPSSPEKIAWNREHFGDEAAAEHARWGGQTIASSGDKIAPHIARHDPARVLAECEAKRRIVHQARMAIRLSDETADDGSPRAERIHGAATAWEYALDAHASVYANHPDFRQEWKS